MPFRKKDFSKYGFYEVLVTILEARHLVPNGDPMVVVQVGNQKKKTLVRKQTDNPFFNEVSLVIFWLLRFNYLVV